MIDLEARARILLVAGSEALRWSATQLLEATGLHVKSVEGFSQARTWLRIHRTELLIAGLDEGPDSAEALRLLADVQQGAFGRRTPVLALSRARTRAQLEALLAQGHLTNFLALGEGEEINPLELAVTVDKILSRRIFGLEPYLGPLTRSESFVVTASSQKDALVERAGKFARECGCHPRLAENLATAMDECVTNAVYNAPVDAERRARFSHLSRNVPVTLDPGQEISLRLASDGRRVGLSTSDPFGSLSPERVQSYLVKCMRRADDQIEDKEGGAGLGLFTVFNSIQHFVINIAPWRRTEVIGLMPVSRSFQGFRSRAKSFNVFVQEGA